MVGPGMGLLLLVGAETSVVLTGLLVAVLGLTYWEASELELDGKVTLWWMLAVLLVHAPGYLALRVWGYLRKRRTA